MIRSLPVIPNDPRKARILFVHFWGKGPRRSSRSWNPGSAQDYGVGVGANPLVVWDVAPDAFSKDPAPGELRREVLEHIAGTRSRGATVPSIESGAAAPSYFGLTARRALMRAHAHPRDHQARYMSHARPIDPSLKRTRTLGRGGVTPPVP